MIKKLLFRSLYIVYIVIFILAIDYIFFYRSFVGEIIDKKRPSREIWDGASRIVDADTHRQLGHLPGPGKKNFLRFSPAKNNGTLRVCALGDSFTYGDEVAYGHDYPSMLEARLRELKGKDVEVLNFGAPWYSFSQTYIMWNKVAKKFSCDYVLLGPKNFLPRRDTTFNHTNLYNPYYLHSRYILADGGVRLVDVIGKNNRERFDNYFSFVPRLRYLRYNKQPPALIKAIIPKGRTVKNPFYYFSGSEKEETAEIYRLLLKKIAEDDAHVVLTNFEDDILKVGRLIENPNLQTIKMPDIKSFPYRAAKQHFSAWGNELVTDVFLTQMLDKSNKVTTLKLTDLPTKVTPGTTPRVPLSAFDSIYVRIGDIPTGFFIMALDWRIKTTVSSSVVKGTGVSSFLAIKNKDQSVLDLCYLPLASTLTEGATLTLKVESSSGATEEPIGKVHLFDKRLNIGVMELEGVSINGCKEVKLISDGEHKMGKGKYTVMMDDRPILEGSEESAEGVALLPADKQILKFALIKARAKKGPFGGIRELDDTGPVSFVLVHPTLGELHVPVARWKKEDIELDKGTE